MTQYTDKPRWATNDVFNATEGEYNVVAPLEAKKDLGFDYFEIPTRQHFNWLAKQTNQWIEYLDEEINQFAAHAAATPDMTVVINAGRVVDSSGAFVSIAEQTTAAFVAPVTDPRIDRIVVDPETGAHSVVAGVEAASPVAPAIPAGKWPVCQILFATTTTSITNDDITDERIMLYSLHSGGSINGDLNVGGGLLFVDDTNGAVGVNNTSPSSILDIAGTFRTTNYTGDPSTGKGIEFKFNTLGDHGDIICYDRSGVAWKDLKIRGKNILLNGGSNNENYIVAVGIDSPKNPSSTFSALQVGSAGWIMSGEGSGSSYYFYLGGNQYYSNGWRAITPNPSSNVYIGEDFYINTAASVAEDAAVTNVERFRIDNDGGLTIGAPTGASKGAGTINVENGIYIDNVEILEPTAVADYLGQQNFYSHDELNNSTILNIYSLIGTSYESVGPTGSGATNIWTPMDIIPSNATAIKVKIDGTARARGAVGDYSFIHIVQGRATGTTLDSNNFVFKNTVMGYTSTTSTTYGVGGSNLCEVTIPVDSSQRFDLKASLTENIPGGATNISLIQMTLVGWYE